jgi:Icc-related predicted phosphoesterase
LKVRAAFVIWVAVFFAQLSAAQIPIEVQIPVNGPFRFVAYGDTRFTDPNDREASNPEARRTLVQAIADAHPAFVSIGGDISYRGSNPKDWKVWDAETTVWRERNIPVLPALGNHDLKGDEATALANYFGRFPEIEHNRYYSMRGGNILMLVLDSSLDETSGAQGSWLNAKLDSVPADVDFVLIVLHHPPYTSSSDAKKYGGGHSSRSPEQSLAKMLEARQPQLRARLVVFSGHVHNYERHEHGGVPFLVTGGGGAHAYPIERDPKDLFQSRDINYHYLLGEVDGRTLKITMNRLELKDGKATWSEPDSFTVVAPAPMSAAPSKQVTANRPARR